MGVSQHTMRQTATAAGGMHPTGMHSSYVIFVELIQNTTIEERVSLLEIQVVEIEEDLTGLDEYVGFLFDEQVIQDERLFSLEQTSLGILEELTVIDDVLDTIGNELEGQLKLC